MKLKIRLNSASIDSALEQIDTYKESLEHKCAEFARRLGELGLDVARSAYLGASYAGVNDVEVHLEFEGNACRIVASGSTLGFIEFGTGVAYPLGEFAEQAGAPPHGSYGQGRGATGNKWVYKGSPGNLGEPDANRPGLVWTKGNPPANAFPQAVEAMMAEAERIAKEVFAF